MSNPLDYGSDAAKLQALAELEKIGCSVGAYDKVSIHVELMPVHMSEDIGSAPIGDSELSRVVDCVNSLGNVHGLDLAETAITDASGPHLARLRNISFLCLAGTSVTDRVLPFLKSVNGLSELVLSETHVTDSAVEPLLEMRELKFLQLYGTKISPKGIAKLKAKRPGVVEA